ncbi:hypothetical protein BDR26DRAFT_864023 [Obelidium mucronatum]|nr:hypothetical protein BDR26DRAFT_864023 [Obelidium mucronatum]
MIIQMEPTDQSTETTSEIYFPPLFSFGGGSGGGRSTCLLPVTHHSIHELSARRSDNNDNNHDGNSNIRLNNVPSIITSPSNSPALPCKEFFETLHKLLQWQPILNTTCQVRHVNNQVFQDQLTNLQIQLNLMKGYQNTISLGLNVITLPECAGCLTAAKSESQAEWGRHVMCEHDRVCPFVSLKNGDRCGCLFKQDSNISNVGQHMMRHYLVPVHHCKCGETFKTIYELKKHQKTHENNATIRRNNNNHSIIDSVGLEYANNKLRGSDHETRTIKVAVSLVRGISSKQVVVNLRAICLVKDLI